MSLWKNCYLLINLVFADALSTTRRIIDKRESAADSVFDPFGQKEIKRKTALHEREITDGKYAPTPHPDDDVDNSVVSSKAAEANVAKPNPYLTPQDFLRAIAPNGTKINGHESTVKLMNPGPNHPYPVIFINESNFGYQVNSGNLEIEYDGIVLKGGQFKN